MVKIDKTQARIRRKLIKDGVINKKYLEQLEEDFLAKTGKTTYKIVQNGKCDFHLG